MNAKKARTSEEIALDRIERDSRCPWPRQSNRPLLHPEIIRNLFDDNEMENEERISGHAERPFRDVAGFSQHDSDGVTEDDFRNRIDFVDCACVDGKSCVCCCTELDYQSFDFRTKERGSVIARSPAGTETFSMLVSVEELKTRGIL